MKLFTCTDHRGHYPTGTASIVLADSKEEAFKMLSDELKRLGLEDEIFELNEVNTKVKSVYVLQDGDY